MAKITNAKQRKGVMKITNNPKERERWRLRTQTEGKKNGGLK